MLGYNLQRNTRMFAKGFRGRSNIRWSTFSTTSARSRYSSYRESIVKTDRFAKHIGPPPIPIRQNLRILNNLLSIVIYCIISYIVLKFQNMFMNIGTKIKDVSVRCACSASTPATAGYPGGLRRAGRAPPQEAAGPALWKGAKLGRSPSYHRISANLMILLETILLPFDSIYQDCLH